MQRPPSYGLGITADPAGPLGAWFGHAGGGPGYQVDCTCLPTSRLGRLGVAVFLNRNPSRFVLESL